MSFQCILIFTVYFCRVDDSPIETDAVPLIMSDRDVFEAPDEGEYLFRSRAASRARRRGLAYYLCDCWKDMCSRFV